MFAATIDDVPLGQQICNPCVRLPGVLPLHVPCFDSVRVPVLCLASLGLPPACVRPLCKASSLLMICPKSVAGLCACEHGGTNVYGVHKEVAITEPRRGGQRLAPSVSRANRRLQDSLHHVPGQEHGDHQHSGTSSRVRRLKTESRIVAGVECGIDAVCD